MTEIEIEMAKTMPRGEGKTEIMTEKVIEMAKTIPRGQRCVLGLKRDIDKERVTYSNGQTDRRTYPVIEMRGAN